MKCLFATIFMVVFCSAYALDCYNCWYDSSLVGNAVAGSDEKCIRDPFKADGIKVETGFNQCYKAIIYKSGKIISAHRGGGKASLASFAELVTRQEDEFEITYCKKNLCNGAPSLVTSLGLLTSFLTVVYSLKYM